MIERIKNPWGIGCLIYGVVLMIMFFAIFGVGLIIEESGGDMSGFGAAFCFPILLWVGGSVPGIILLYQKKYFAWFSGIVGGVGCIILFIFGVIAIPIGLWLWTMLGSLLWPIALILPPRRECPHCTKVISGRASKCPNCGGEVESIA